MTYDFNRRFDAMRRLTKYEKETIILTSDGDKTYTVFTYNKTLKRRLAEFTAKYPEVCKLESENQEYGSQTYVVAKGRLAIRLTAPYSEERRKSASEYSKEHGIHKKQRGHIM